MANYLRFHLGPGALAGNRLLSGDNARQGWLGNIVVGIVGGFLFSPLTGRSTYFDWNIGSFMVAVIGPLVLLFIPRLVRRAQVHRAQAISPEPGRSPRRLWPAAYAAWPGHHAH